MLKKNPKTQLGWDHSQAFSRQLYLCLLLPKVDLLAGAFTLQLWNGIEIVLRNSEPPWELTEPRSVIVDFVPFNHLSISFVLQNNRCLHIWQVGFGKMDKVYPCNQGGPFPNPLTWEPHFQIRKSGLGYLSDYLTYVCLLISFILDFIITGS